MLTFLLIVVAHSGVIVGSSRPVYASIYVRDCGGAYRTIYADKELSTILPNPFMSYKDGSYRYFSTTPYGQVTIAKDGQATTTRVCKAEKK